MRRSRLRRGKPLGRGNRPHRATLLQRRTRITFRAKASPVGRADCDAIWRRSGGRCEIGGEPVDRDGFDPQHRKRSREGDHRLCNLLVTCRSHHERIHAEPAEARHNGWTVSFADDPQVEPVTLGDGRMVLLTEDGGYQVLSGTGCPTHGLDGPCSCWIWED